MAAQVADIFTEVLIAPGFEDAALETLKAKKNLRLLCCPAPATATAQAQAPAPAQEAPPQVEWRPVDGGVLLQTADRLDAPGDDPAAWELKAGRAVSAETLADLAFAWRACRAAKSNAIVLAADGATVGVGMGQVNRVDAARIAIARSGQRCRGAVAASDAYFPFADGLQVLADAGVRAIAEPGGSIRDGEVIAAAQAAGVSLYFTGTRHFFH
jgi:phosphoribosylaminoimidazolecarboxamide formyltransferase/IMP cyclohydrolase